MFMCNYLYVCILFLVDVTSCVLWNGGCDQLCSLGAEGRVKCSCREGWELASDQRTCLGNKKQHSTHTYTFTNELITDELGLAFTYSLTKSLFHSLSLSLSLPV